MINPHWTNREIKKKMFAEVSQLLSSLCNFQKLSNDEPGGQSLFWS